MFTKIINDVWLTLDNSVKTSQCLLFLNDKMQEFKDNYKKKI